MRGRFRLCRGRDVLIEISKEWGFGLAGYRFSPMAMRNVACVQPAAYGLLAAQDGYERGPTQSRKFT